MKIIEIINPFDGYKSLHVIQGKFPAIVRKQMFETDTCYLDGYCEIAEGNADRFYDFLRDVLLTPDTEDPQIFIFEVIQMPQRVNHEVKHG